MSFKVYWHNDCGYGVDEFDSREKAIEECKKIANNGTSAYVTEENETDCEVIYTQE
jgi:hypothetical protein